jgi:hypothetical protein
MLTCPQAAPGGISSGIICIRFFHTYPLSPFQPEAIMDMRIIFWLEAGVKERGGCTPSQILFPLSNMLTEVFYLVEFERGTEGVSISWQLNANGTSFEDLPRKVYDRDKLGTRET